LFARLFVGTARRLLFCCLVPLGGRASNPLSSAQGCRCGWMGLCAGADGPRDRIQDVQKRACEGNSSRARTHALTHADIYTRRRRHKDTHTHTHTHTHAHAHADTYKRTQARAPQPVAHAHPRVVQAMATKDSQLSKLKAQLASAPNDASHGDLGSFFGIGRRIGGIGEGSSEERYR
jgi:hypothetical protein